MKRGAHGRDKKAKGKTQNKSRCQMMISLGPELCVAGEPFSLRYIRTWSFSQTKQVDLRDTSAQQSPRTSEKGQNIESNPTTHLPFFSLSLFFCLFFFKTRVGFRWHQDVALFLFPSSSSESQHKTFSSSSSSSV